MIFNTTKLLALAELFKQSCALYTNDGIVSQSTYHNKEKLCDNEFGGEGALQNFNETLQEFNPWMNITLTERSTIAAVLLFNRQDCCQSRLKWTSIRIGNNSLPIHNPECAGNIDRDGMYICKTGDAQTLMTGDYVGIIRLH